MTIICQYNLIDFFNKTIYIPNCEEKTKSYIISIFAELQKTNLINESAVLAFKRAQEKMSFREFKELGDWLFFAKSIFPTYLNASYSLYEDIAKISYY